MASDSNLVLLGLAGAAAYAIYCAMKKNAIMELKSPMEQVTTLPFAKIPDGARIVATEHVHQNRTDLVASNGIRYTVYTNGGSLPSSVQRKIRMDLPSKAKQ
jgi:hypothetical protein